MLNELMLAATETRVCVNLGSGHHSVTFTYRLNAVSAARLALFFRSFAVCTRTDQCSDAQGPQTNLQTKDALLDACLIELLGLIPAAVSPVNL
jgi:hypothetical protein